MSLFYFDTTGGICKTCDPSCLTCTGPSSSDCLTCLNLNYQLVSRTDKTCICKTKDCQDCSDPSTTCQKCSIGFTLDTSDQLCKTCDSSCKECSALGPNSCTACQKDKTLFTQTSTACSPTSPDSGCCFSCLVSDCLACQSDDVCHNCKSGFDFENNKCVASQPKEGQTVLGIKTSFDSQNGQYVIRLSEAVSYNLLLADSTLTYNKEAFNLTLDCSG